MEFRQYVFDFLRDNQTHLMIHLDGLKIPDYQWLEFTSAWEYA